MTVLDPASRPHACDGYSVAVGPLDELPINTVLAPQATVLTLILEAFGRLDRGTPERVLAAVRGAMPPRAQRAFAPIFRPMLGVFPTCLSPAASGWRPSFESYLDQVHATSDDELRADVLGHFGPGGLPAAWCPAVERPEQWVADAALGLDAVWQGVVEPLWTQCLPLLERESDRVAIAAARGASDVVLSGLHERVSYADGTITLADSTPGLVERGHRPLVLTPMVAGRRSVIASWEDEGQLRLNYAVPGLREFVRDRQLRAERPDALTIVLGAIRADLLRDLDRPITVGAIATAQHRAPNTISYHCDQLVAAGLVQRRRAGKSVLVSRTERGSALLDLLGDGARRLALRSA